MATKAPKILLPEDWTQHVKTGILHCIALAQMALTAARAHASRKRGVVARLRAQLEERDREISQLEEELRLKDLRIGRRLTFASRPIETCSLDHRAFVTKR